MAHAPIVAQLDRASYYGSEGSGSSPCGRACTKPLLLQRFRSFWTSQGVVNLGMPNSEHANFGLCARADERRLLGVAVQRHRRKVPSTVGCPWR